MGWTDGKQTPDYRVDHPGASDMLPLLDGRRVMGPEQILERVKLNFEISSSRLHRAVIMQDARDNGKVTA